MNHPAAQGAQYPAFDPSRPVCNIGMGVMGTKVAWACARAGIDVQAFDVDVGKAHASKALALTWSDGAERDNVARCLSVHDHLESALENVQLAFENVPERLELKQQVLAEVGRLLDQRAYMGTNASSLICSPLAEASGRPERFFNLNFSDPRTSRSVELMSCEATAPATVTFAKAWSRAIRMVPLWVPKEQLGYSLNRLWREIKKEVLRQIDQGYTTPETIDRAWMLIFGTEIGPCGIMDDIGLHSVLAVEKVYYEDSGDESDRPPKVLTDLIARNELGVISGRGFYEYPNPAYQQEGFLEGTED